MQLRHLTPTAAVPILAPADLASVPTSGWTATNQAKSEPQSQILGYIICLFMAVLLACVALLVMIVPYDL